MGATDSLKNKLKGYGFSSTSLQSLGDRSMEMYLDIIEGRRYPTESQVNSMKGLLSHKDQKWVWPWQSEAPSWAKGLFTVGAGTLGALAGGAGLGALAARGVPGALGSALGSTGTIKAAQGLSALASHPKLTGTLGAVGLPFLADALGSAIGGGSNQMGTANPPWLNQLSTMETPTGEGGTDTTGETDADTLLDEYLAGLLGGEAPKVVDIGGTQYFLDPYQGWVQVAAPTITSEQELANQKALIEAQKQAELDQLYAQNPYLYWAQKNLGLPSQIPQTQPTQSATIPQEGVAPALQGQQQASWNEMLSNPSAPSQLAALATPTGLTTPSMQSWNRMSPSEQQLVQGTANWLGINPEDWEFYRKRKAPPAGNSGRMVLA